MIYYIDKSCVEALNSKDESAAEFLEQLVIHRRKCKNMVIAEKSVLKDLGKSEELSPFARNYYRILANRSSEFRLILSKAKKYYKIVSSYHGEKVVKINGQAIINLSIEEGNKGDFTDKSILLVESDDDIDFYEQIGNYYLRNSGVSHINISFETMIGGGNTTDTVLKRIVDENQRTCLCVMDSDKKYFGAQEGGTLKKALKVFEGKGTPNVELYPLPVHEIENLIPVNILDVICEDIPSAKTGIKFLEFLLNQDASVESPVYYFDYKKGIAKDKFILKKNLSKNEEKKFRRLEGYRTYWGKFIEDYGIKIDGNVNDPIISGVCEKILKHSIKYLKEYGRDNVISSDSYIYDLWMDLGECLVTWGCVGNRIPA